MLPPTAERNGENGWSIDAFVGPTCLSGERSRHGREATSPVPGPPEALMNAEQGKCRH
jgi:hypothetical protein